MVHGLRPSLLLSRLNLHLCDLHDGLAVLNGLRLLSCKHGTELCQLSSILGEQRLDTGC